MNKSDDLLIEMPAMSDDVKRIITKDFKEFNVIINRTCIEIENYELGDSPRLERSLSLFDKQTR